MNFFSPDFYAARINAIFNTLKQRLERAIPDCEVEHIGSTAIVWAISKGDLDILVRVNAGDVRAAVHRIEQIGFTVKAETLRTESLCMLITDEFREDVAIQVVAAGSEFEDFVTFRDRLNSDHELVMQYNELKLASTGLSPEGYRMKKAEFVRAVLAIELNS